MMTALIISQCVMAAILVSFALMLLALGRQIGVLHERLVPLQATDGDQGLKIGKALPRMTLEGIGGPGVPVGERLTAGHRQLLLFVAPDCPLCKRVLPSALTLGESQQTELVVVGDGAPVEIEALGKAMIKGRAPLTMGAELGLILQVNRLPFAAVINDDGILAARGLVQSGAHLEALLQEAA